ncbi:MAG TPA: phosphodiester glycosidase family protein [Sphingomicrobium sp.]
MRGLPILLLLVAACRSEPPGAEQQALPSLCVERDFEDSQFFVCDPSGGEIRLVAAAAGEKPVRSFSELQSQLNPDAVAFAMNAGMFGEDGRPIGLAIVDGTEVRAINTRKGGGNFHLMPNGIFLVQDDGRAQVVSTDQFEPAVDIKYATQSGPMLVINGDLHPKFEPDGESRHIRNAVGVKNGIALFVISRGPVSFGKLARFFRDDLKTPNALYFDGSVSSLWDPADNRQDSHSPLGPMVVVLRPR